MHICDKPETHETCVLDYFGSHACPLVQDALGHVQGTDCNCIHKAMWPWWVKKKCSLIITEQQLFYGIDNITNTPFSKTAIMKYIPFFNNEANFALFHRLTVNLFKVDLKHYVYSVWNILDWSTHHRPMADNALDLE